MFVRLARLAAWNAALILAGLALVAIAGEAYLRLSGAFVASSMPLRFVPGVGLLYEPHAEVRFTNGLDFWTVQRANGLGFLDREPPAPERAAASCHVAVFGDSVVEAIEVPIEVKFQVRLEALAAAALPELDIAASAWGRRGTGQANHLPYYDEYVRPLRPNLVVLLVNDNDFEDNSAVLRALRLGWDPARMPYAYPERDAAWPERAAAAPVRLRPPHPDFQLSSELPGWELNPRPASERWHEALARELTGRALFARWLDAKRQALIPRDQRLPFPERVALTAALPGYGWVLDGWEPTDRHGLVRLLLAEDPPPVFAEALADMAWVLAEFKRRADRDGAALAILAAHGEVGYAHTRHSELLRGMAEPLGIPVISQPDWIARSGGRIKDAHWPHDRHWTPQGHQWAAEALFDWLRRRPEVCEDRAARRPGAGGGRTASAGSSG